MTAIRFSVGLDLGDAESALAVCSVEGYQSPTVPEGRPTPTVIASRRGDGRRRMNLIGIEALINSEARQVRLNFKQDPTGEDTRWEDDAGHDLLTFAEELVKRDLDAYPWERGDTQLVVGYPAAWQPDVVNRYRQLFASSHILPQRVIVVPESRSALVQFWLTEQGLRDRLVAGSVIVVDIGSSTVDITKISNGETSEDPASQGLGLFEVDERLLQKLLHIEGPELDQRFNTYPAQHELALYLSRLRKEQEYGKLPDPHLIDQLLAGRKGPTSWWGNLQSITVRDVLGDMTDHESWLGRFSALLADVASRHAGQRPLVIVTGGGAAIPDLFDAVRSQFSGCDVKVAADPELAVAKGLSDYGRLLVNGNQFIDDVLALLVTRPYAQRLVDLYPRFYCQLMDYYIRHNVDGIWAPMSRLWTSGDLKLAERGDFRSYALSLFQNWLQNDGQETYGPLMSQLNEDVSSIVRDAISEVLKRLPVQVRPLALHIQLPLAELFETSSPGGKLISNTVWTAQGAIFKAIDHAPLTVRRTLGGKFMEAALHGERSTKDQLASIAATFAKTGRVPVEFSNRLDTYIHSGVQTALQDALAEIRLLLLKTHNEA